MKVFIENQAGSHWKNLFDEKRLEFQERIKVARAYPFPYGFILNTTAEDGDNVDAYVLTKTPLKTGEIIEVEVIGLMEQFEKSWDESKGEEDIDHNVIVVPKNDDSLTLNEEVQTELKAFVLHVFDDIRANKTRIGEFKSKEAALKYIKEHLDGSF